MTNVPKAVEHQIAGGTLKDMVRELTAENRRLRALLNTADITPDSDPQTIRDGQIEQQRLWFEKEQELDRLKAENAMYTENITYLSGQVLRGDVKHKQDTAENARLTAALRAILDSQTFNPASLESDLYHVIPDSVLDAAGKVLEMEQPNGT